MSGVHLETKKIGDIQNDPKHVEKQKKREKKIPEREASPYAAPVEAIFENYVKILSFEKSKC